MAYPDLLVHDAKEPSWRGQHSNWVSRTEFYPLLMARNLENKSQLATGSVHRVNGAESGPHVLPGA